jgi:polygalacturonase
VNASKKSTKTGLRTVLGRGLLRGRLLRGGLIALAVSGLAATGATASAAAAGATPPAQESASTMPGATFNVRDYGAKGNGSADDSAAFDKAVTAASAAGGGIVEVPSGTYKSAHTVHLKSHVTIQLDAGSTVTGASGNSYDQAEANPYDQYQDYGHSHFHDAMFYGDGLTGIGFTGSGTIDGGGHLITGNPKSGQADKIISLTRCSGLTLSGVTLKRGGHFAALINGCTGVTSDNLTIATSDDRDGWNIISTTGVTITNPHISSNDDALVFKSDYALGKKLPNGNVKVTGGQLQANCCNALMFGSETCGDFTGYSFDGITITGAHKSGIGIVSMDGAKISDVHYRNITMSGTYSPVMMKIGSRKRCGGNPGVGSISDITFDHVTGSYAGSGSFSPTLWGADAAHEVHNVTFTDVNLTVPGGNGTMSTDVPGNNATDYNPNSIGTRPSYGWYLHYTDGITFTGSSLKFAKDDGRPAAIVNHSSDITFRDLTVHKGAKSPFDIGFQSVQGYCLSGKTSTGGDLRVKATDSSATC